ncbi:MULTISPECIES: hypothetical protein [Halorussus]|uniref:hypothetical protein n=1 Tax=Halorussus TaxID=1070314 RepID=UPI000E218978|nr:MULTISPECIES: hypothetical protein [Halorussus]NHN60461.1 hypothetical protein [Halorussus sp. JP-T4]
MTEDIPQPATEPYSEGDRVKVYLAKDDTDSALHGTTGVVDETLRDSLGEETGRSTDSVSYRIETDEGVLNTWFRHHDLVPATEE